MVQNKIGKHKYQGQTYDIVVYSRGGTMSPQSIYLENNIRRITPKQIRLLNIHFMDLNVFFKLMYSHKIHKLIPHANHLLKVIKSYG